MTSKALFNKGAFNTVIKRFRPGSFLYFALLFFSLPVVFWANTPQDLQVFYGGTGSLLYSGAITWFSAIVTMIVPSVVALLVYHNVHSPRHSVFAHSLPISKKAIWFSSLCGAMVLMAVPVIIIGIILGIMSETGYSVVISTTSVAIWVLAAIVVQFVLYSVATFCAYLTGNSFAAVAINLIVLLIPAITGLAVYQMCEMFAYGFIDSGMSENILMASPIIHFGNDFFGSNILKDFFAHTYTWAAVVCAVIIYLLSFLLYSKRKMQYCSDVAAFKVLRPILKYVVCTIGAILSISIFYNLGMSAFLIFSLSAVVCAIVYFACEMLLRKTLKVFDSFKGLIIFCIAVAAFLTFMAFSSVFGYETRVPEISDVQSFRVEEGAWSDREESSDTTVVPYLIDFHKTQVKNRTNLKPCSTDYENCQSVIIRYFLKDGSTLAREYWVSKGEKHTLMEKLFTSNEYKEKFFGINHIIPEKITTLNIEMQTEEKTQSFVIVNPKKFFECVKKDIEEMSYSNYIKEYKENGYVNISYEKGNKLTDDVFTEDFKEKMGGRYACFDIIITPAFKHTYRYLTDSLGEPTFKNRTGLSSRQPEECVGTENMSEKIEWKNDEEYVILEKDGNIEIKDRE